MTVRLEATIKRYIGHSTDTRPRPGVSQPDGTTLKIADLPPGSSFLEEDTGRVFRWDGTFWAAAPVDETQVELLAAILREFRALRAELGTGLPVTTI